MRRGDSKLVGRIGLLCAALLCGGCAEGMAPAEGGDGTPRLATAAEMALERLNRAQEEGRVVFYCRADVAAELSAGEAFAADDRREVWRFGVLGPAEARDGLDLSDPRVHITAHLPDPACRPRDECDMVTLTRGEDGRLSVSGSASIERAEDGGLRLFFVMDAVFTTPDGVHGTMRYRGGGHPGHQLR